MYYKNVQIIFLKYLDTFIIVVQKSQYFWEAINEHTVGTLGNKIQTLSLTHQVPWKLAFKFLTVENDRLTYTAVFFQGG